MMNKFVFFFLSGFSFTDTDESWENRGREGTIFYSTLPLPPAHKHKDSYLQLWMWDYYHVFLFAMLVFSRLLLDEIDHLIKLPFDWLIDDSMFVCSLDELILGFCYSDFDMGNWWIWTHINHHHCIASEPTNQVCYSPPRQTIYKSIITCISYNPLLQHLIFLPMPYITNFLIVWWL